jgi:hypothetical protein
MGIDSYRTSGTPEGKGHECRLPTHHHGQRLGLIQSRVGFVSKPALGWSASDVVVHSVADKDFHRAVVEHHREVHLEDPFDLAENATSLIVEMQHLGRLIHAVLGRAV